MEKIILFSAIITMFIGVCIDIKKRRFPNQLFLVLIVLGIIYKSNLLANISLAAAPLSLFLIFNICGIFFHKYKIIAPGDMKFFSVFPFFIEWDEKTSLFFLLVISVTAVIFSFVKMYKREQSIKKILLNFKYQLLELKIFMLSRIRISPDYTEINKNEGFAFTLQLFIAFMTTLLCQQAGLF